MDKFKYAHAEGDDWQELVDECLIQLGNIPKEANLGFLYVTDKFARELNDLFSYLKDQSSVKHWVGSLGIGVCCTGVEYYDKPAIVMMITAFPENSFQEFNTTNNNLEDFRFKHNSWYQDNKALFGVVHSSPEESQIPSIIADLADDLDEGFLVGGLVSSRKKYLHIADDVYKKGVSGVLFSNDVAVNTGLTQACMPFGDKHEVTESQRNVIMQLDMLPALDVFYNEIGEELAGNVSKIAGNIFVAFPVYGSDTQEFLVRNIVGLDLENKVIAIGETVLPGEEIIFTKRNADIAREDLLKMLHNIKLRLKNPPKGGLYYSCLGRGSNLFGDNSEELKLIQQVLGDFPLVGFFANGEISNNRLYGYVGVLTLFL
jgi:small ligand-binding sensory domain FIST